MEGESYSSAGEDIEDMLTSDVDTNSVRHSPARGMGSRKAMALGQKGMAWVDVQDLVEVSSRGDGTITRLNWLGSMVRRRSGNPSFTTSPILPKTISGLQRS